MTRELPAARLPFLAIAVALSTFIMLAVPAGLAAQNDKQNDEQQEPASQPALEPAPATRLSDAPLAPYATDPNHIWNKLHSALFVRTTAEGMSYGHDELDPLLWPESKYLLVGEHHKYVLGLLDEFLASESDKLVNDPLKRVVLQHDLWSIFDWLDNPNAVYGYRSDADTREQRALQVRLAKIIWRLALSAEQIRQLPDNYAAALAAKAFPASHNPEKPDIAFLPADLFQPDGPWVLLGEHMASAAPVHLRKVQGRSAFFVFMNLPGGRMATLAYLKELEAFPNPLSPRPIDRSLAGPKVSLFNPQLPQFPIGTQLALVREMLVIDDHGKIEPTHLIESMQLRVFREIPTGDALQPEDTVSLQGKQDFYEFRITRKDLFSGASGGLHAVTPQEVDFVPLNPHSKDEFDRRPSGPLGQPILKSCAGCHGRPGIHSVEAFRRSFIRLPVLPRLSPYDRRQQEDAAMAIKREDHSWGLFQGLLDGTEGAKPTAAAKPAHHGVWGSIAGRVVFQGELNADQVKRFRDDIEVRQFRDVQGPVIATMPNQSLLVDPKTGGLKNVFVYLRTKPEVVRPPDPDRPADVLEVVCRDHQFSPRELIVQVGQTVRLRVESEQDVSDFKGEFIKNMSFYALLNSKQSLDWKPTAAETLPLRVASRSLHGYAVSDWLVLDHPYAALTAVDGAFRIDDLPPGEHELFVWHETIGFVAKKLKVDVKPGATTELAPVTFTADRLKK